LQCVLAARILTVDFVVSTLAVKKKNQGRFRHVGSDHSLVSRIVPQPTTLSSGRTSICSQKLWLMSQVMPNLKSSVSSADCEECDAVQSIRYLRKF
jgi:hypothetical protein